MHKAQEGYNQLVIQPVLPKTRSHFTMSPCAPPTTTASHPAPKRKGRPSLCPATASTPSRWNRLTHRSMVQELQNKNVATDDQVWPLANSRRMWARKRTSGWGPCDIDRAAPGAAGRRESRYESWVRAPDE